MKHIWTRVAKLQGGYCTPKVADIFAKGAEEELGPKEVPPHQLDAQTLASTHLRPRNKDPDISYYDDMI